MAETASEIYIHKCDMKKQQFYFLLYHYLQEQTRISNPAK